MKPIKILYLDDEKIQHQVMKAIFKQCDAGINAHFYLSGNELLFHLEDHLDADLIILDVEMPHMDGLEVARKIRENLPSIPLVFITAYGQYAIKGYEVFAMDYLLKPVTVEQINRLLSRLRGLVKEKARSVVLEIDQQTVRLAESDIFSIESQGHLQVLTLLDQRVEVAITMKELMTRLSDHFVPTHRSYAVNINHVYQIQKEFVLLDNRESVPLSRRLYKSVLDQFVKHYQTKEYSL